PVARSADISTSTIAVAHIRALTTAPRIKPTSIFLRSARRLNPGRGSTYRRGIFVQTTGTSSLACDPLRRWVGCDVDPDEVSAVEPDNDQGIEQVETDSWNSEQVHGGNVRRVVTQEGSPSL